MKRIIPLLCGCLMMWSATVHATPPERFTFGPMDFKGLFFSECAGFNVLMDFTYSGEYFVYFGADGFPERMFYKQRYPIEYYNSLYPDIRVFANKFSGDQRWLEIEDGQLVLNNVHIHANVTVPGYGIIVQDVGRIELDLRTFEITFRARDYSVDFDALCEVLSP